MAKIIKYSLTSGQTGGPFKLGTTKPPYTIYSSGGYTGATVAVQSCAEVDGTFIPEFGRGGGALTPADADQALAMPDAAIGVIEHKIEYIKFVAGGITGTAVIELVAPC